VQHASKQPLLNSSEAAAEYCGLQNISNPLYLMPNFPHGGRPAACGVVALASDYERTFCM